MIEITCFQTMKMILGVAVGVGGGGGRLHHVVGDGPHGVQEEGLTLGLHNQNLDMDLEYRQRWHWLQIFLT